MLKRRVSLLKTSVGLWLLAIAFDVGDKIARESFKAMAPDLKSIPENQPQPLPIPSYEQARNRNVEQPVAVETLITGVDHQPRITITKPESLEPVPKVPELDKQNVRPELTGETVAQLSQENTAVRKSKEEQVQPTPAELVGEQPLQITDSSTHPDVQNQSRTEEETPIEVGPETTGDLFDKVVDSPEMAEAETQSVTV